MKRSALAAVALLAGCATQGPLDPELQSMDESRLPPANVTLSIPGLGPCTDNPDRSLRLDARQPVTVLVHGCYGSSGRFRGLAQVLAFHGQQTACFTYDYRDSMMQVSGNLAAALERLAQATDNRQVTVIGHSQGGLIARKSLVADRPAPLSDRGLALRLVTVSTPFAGIAAANHCGNATMRTLSLGLVGLACRLITGEKWSEITYTSEFIVRPGALHRQVREHLKIDTDESGTPESVFSLAEQRNAAIDRDPLTRLVEVAAGHGEIVGDHRVAPRKLIGILQDKGVINPTVPDRRAAFDALLSQLYGP